MKKFFAICLAFLFAFACISCAGEKYIHPDFETEYTVEEHVERIRKRTEERYAEEIESGELVDFEVEIVYAFYDDDPEYFLVEFEYAEEFWVRYGDEKGTKYQTKYKHLIGFIQNDDYWLCAMINIYENYGRSSFDVFGYSDAKKYYGHHIEAVALENGKILQIYDGWFGGDALGSNPGHLEFHYINNPTAGCFTQKIVTEDRYKDLMEKNYKGAVLKY